VASLTNSVPSALVAMPVRPVPEAPAGTGISTARLAIGISELAGTVMSCTLIERPPGMFGFTLGWVDARMYMFPAASKAMSPSRPRLPAK
jgi:hypothetical protein